MKQGIIEGLRAKLGQDLKGDLLGFSAWLNFRVEALDEQGQGMCLSFEVRSEMLNPFGILHGGVLAAMIDEAMGFQLFLLSALDEQFVALNLQLDFLRGTSPGQKLYIRPSLVRKGRRIANLSCRVEDGEGKLIAQASSNFSRL